MASQSNSNMWKGTVSFENSVPANPALKREEEQSWKTPTSSQSTTNMDIKVPVISNDSDNVGTPSFKFPALECKEALEQEWYTPETSLMELSYSSPYEISYTRTGFGLLDSSLNFDSTSNLISSFRTAPSTLDMDHLACTGQGSSVGLLSSISPGGPPSLSNPMDSFSSGLSTLGFNQRIVNQSGNPSNITNSNDGPRNELLPHQISKRTENSYLQEQQSLFHKHSASNGTTTPASKSPPQVATSASNDSIVGTSEKDSSHLQNTKLQNEPGRVDLYSGSDDPNDNMGLDADEDNGKDDDDLDESGDGSGGPCEVEEGAGHGENHAKGAKGKRGLPAKNLMAERRRRKKLNDRLYLLRSVVPKITKMDRASILGDAIEYLKELLQRINDIHKELEAAKLEQSRSMPTSPVGGRTPRPTQGYPAAVKEECPVLPNPESQPPRVEVRKREGQALNIHMFCARRPGLLLNTVRALDALGLDVQQAVISCFNGFALDLFRAEAKNADVGPDEIKAVLLLTAGCGMHSLQ